MVLINCGGYGDLKHCLPEPLGPHMRLLIIDSHRPLAHVYNDDDPAFQVPPTSPAAACQLPCSCVPSSPQLGSSVPAAASLPCGFLPAAL